MADSITISAGGSTVPGDLNAKPGAVVGTTNADGSVNVNGAAPVVAPAAPAAPAAPVTPAPVAPTGDAPFVPKITPPVEKSTIDLSKAVTEFGKDGKVSDATYAAAEAKGLSRADVDTYLAGHKSRVDGVANALSELAGGQDNLKAVIEWAGANTDEATRNAFNSAMERADTPTAKLMLRGMIAEYQETVGVEGQRLTGNGGGPAVLPFTSWDQMRQAMSDPRYNKDTAYQQSVYARVAVSKL